MLVGPDVGKGRLSSFILFAGLSGPYEGAGRRV